MLLFKKSDRLQTWRHSEVLMISDVQQPYKVYWADCLVRYSLA